MGRGKVSDDDTGVERDGGGEGVGEREREAVVVMAMDGWRMGMEYPKRPR